LATATTPKRPARSLWVNAILIALAFGLLALAVYQNRTQVHDVLNRPIDVRLLAAGFGVYTLGLVVSFLRWYALVRVIDARFTLGAAFLLGFIGNVFNLVIPGAVGGDFVKAAYLVRMDVNRTQAIASMVIDRILGLLGLFLLAGVAGTLAWPMATTPVRVLIVLVGCAVVTGFLVLAAIFNQSLTRRFPSLLEGHGKLAGILHELTVMSKTYRRRLDVVAGCLAASVLVHFLMVTAFYAASRAIFTQAIPSYPRHLLIVPLILFSTAVPLPFGALGLTENISGELFKLVSHPGGVVAMMAFRVVMYAGGLVSLGVYLANLRQVRGLTEAAQTLEEELLENDLPDPDQ
jgi:uncharacterized membrane protein YbhN (UPF0104 family)